jgi:hypothetical protein
VTAGTATVEWVHPSVRDTVIEYLMDHDLERLRFLRTARARGVLTALSTAGGATGTLTRPLLRSQEDWQALDGTVSRIVSQSDIGEHYVLLQGLKESLRASDPLEGAAISVRKLVVTLLTALTTNWSKRTKAIDISALGLFYELSVRVDELIPSPDLSPTWRNATATLEDALADELAYDAIVVVARWVRLVKLLVRNEPRFVLIREGVGGVAARAERIISWIQAWTGALPWLDEYESEWTTPVNGDPVEMGEVEAPVQPDSIESHDRFLLDETLGLVGDAAELATDVEKSSDALIGEMHEHMRVREARQERYDDWESEMRSDEAISWRTARGQGSGDFDIVEFFSDL